jgi:hypothetical protein
MSDPRPILSYDTPDPSRVNIDPKWVGYVRAGMIFLAVDYALVLTVWVFPTWRMANQATTVVRDLLQLTGVCLITMPCQQVAISAKLRWFLRGLAIIAAPLAITQSYLINAILAKRMSMPSSYYSWVSAGRTLTVASLAFLTFYYLYLVLAHLGRRRASMHAMILAITLMVVALLPMAIPYSLMLARISLRSYSDVMMALSYLRVAASIWATIYLALRQSRLIAPSD